MIYRVVLFRAKPDETRDVRWIGSLDAVKRWAATLPPVVTTKYNIGRDVGRSWLMAVSAYKGKQRPLSTFNIGPEVHIVPSVGELGYW